MTEDEYNPTAAPIPTVFAFGPGMRHAARQSSTSALQYPRITPGSVVTARHTTPYNYSWTGVCWAAELGLFVAVNGHGTGIIMTSPDGATWTMRNTGSGRFNSVAWFPSVGKFIAFDTYGGDNYRVYTSSDGITWSASATQPPGWSIDSVCWSPELARFVAVSGTSLCPYTLTSDDGITWTARGYNFRNYWSSVCWASDLGLFCAVSGNSYDNVMTSPDGITWTARKVEYQWASVCWAAELGLFCAVGNGGTNSAMTSPDGINWTIRSTPAGLWEAVCWSPEVGLFFAVGRGDPGQHAMTSPDGITWTSFVTPGLDTWRSVCWSPRHMAFVVGAASSGTKTIVLTATYTLQVDKGYHAVLRDGELSGSTCQTASHGTSRAGASRLFRTSRIVGTERFLCADSHHLEALGSASAPAARWRINNGTFIPCVASRHSLLYPRRHRVFARDTATGSEHDLGVTEENPDEPGTFTLADVPLADGVYEVAVRSTNTLWADTRSHTVSTFRLRAGEDPTPELPAVVEFRVGLTSNGWRMLTWSVAGDPGDTVFMFGVWFGDGPAVDLSGPPTATLSRVRGLDYYEHYFQQSAPQWVAVAAYTAGGARGQPAELFLKWDAERPAAPAHQWATEHDARLAPANMSVDS